MKCLFRVSSGSNERPLNSESLIMSVLIIKRELAGTKQLKSHYQTSLQRRGEKRRGERRRGEKRREERRGEGRRGEQKRRKEKKRKENRREER